MTKNVLFFFKEWQQIAGILLLKDNVVIAVSVFLKLPICDLCLWDVKQGYLAMLYFAGLLMGNIKMMAKSPHTCCQQA